MAEAGTTGTISDAAPAASDVKGGSAESAFKSVSSADTSQSTTEGDFDNVLAAKVDELLQSSLKAPKEPVEGESSDPEKEAEVAKEGEVEAPAEEAKEEEKVEDGEGEKEAQPPFHNHPRWKQVLKERDDARAVFDKTKAELESIKPQAEGFVRLQEYCQKHRIADNEVQEALDLLALSKSDTKAFRERLQTYADVIDYAQGTRLPRDLQEKVDSGILPESDAQELSRYRLQKEHLDRTGNMSAQAQHERLVSDITQGINAWQQDNAKRDPGFNDPDRLAMLTDRIHSLWNVKQPTDVRSAIAIAEQANADVKARLAKLRPTPPVRKHLPANGSSTKPKSVAPVATMDELEQKMYEYGMKRLAAQKA